MEGYMRPVKIVSDSCSDLDKHLREKYDIDYLRMKTIMDGKEQWASLDFEYYSPKELYDYIRAGNRVYTDQVPTAEFERVFGKYAQQGMDIVYIGVSDKQSGTVGAAQIVAKEMMDKDPDLTIHCINSLNACMGEGLLAIRAAGYRDAGMNADEICEKIMSERNNILEYTTVHNLDTLRRTGRVKASAAFFGNMLGIKPINIADAAGYQTPIKKVKGRYNSLCELVNLMKENVIAPEEQCIYIVHSDCLDEAEQLRDMVMKEIPFKESYISNLGPIIGGAMGPGSLALLAYGKEVTYKVAD